MSTPSPSLESQYCKARQTRLLEAMQRLKLDRVVVVLPEHVQWLTGFRPHRLMAACVALDADGHCLLAAPNKIPEDAAADAVVTFAAQWHSTLRQEQPFASLTALGEGLKTRTTAKSVGVEFSTFGPHGFRAVGITNADMLTDIEPELWHLRRNKDPDELGMIRRAIACTDGMYARAKEIIEPGITEIEVFNQLHAAAVEVAGEPLTALGNDYQCNSPGGSPRMRRAEKGELFVLDLGPAYRGYYADNCRTFVVDANPTDEQHAAWKKIVETLELVERSVKPGVRCQELFASAQSLLDTYREGAFSHHLGHGFGLFPHEAPHLNPHWDDAFAEGDVFTAEPGLYGPELRAGIRLEQNYRVTADGVERLTSFPLDLD